MWSNFVTQIQQRIDDAADLLGDEEGEDEQFGDDVDGYVDTQQLRVPEVSRPPLPTSTHGEAAYSSVDVIHAPSDALDVGAKVVEHPAELASEPLADADNANAFLSEASASTPPPPPPLPPAQPTLSPPMTGAPAYLPVGPPYVEDAPASSAASRCSSAPARIEGAEEAEMDQLASPPVAPAISESPLLPPINKEMEEPTQPPPSSLPAASETPSSASDGAFGVSFTEAPSNSPDATTAPNPPNEAPTTTTGQPASPPELPGSEKPTESAPVRHADAGVNGVAQLLRFQQQLAEEMENVSTLQGQNSFLRSRVGELEEELSQANDRLRRVAGSEEQLSVLIEKLGKEKERHKVAATARAELVEHVQDLEEELEEYRVKEQGWISGSEQRRENDTAAHQRIMQLEKELRIRDAIVEESKTRLQDVSHKSSILERQVDDLKASYSTQLDTVKESNLDTVDQLRREVDQLRTSLQTLAMEYNRRTGELEREVQQANQRAQEAEARFSDVEVGSVTTLQDLRAELEDAERSIAAWRSEAQKARGEYTELLDHYGAFKRSRTATEADLRDRLAAEANTVRTLRKGNQSWEERCQFLQASLTASRAELEEQKKSVLLLEEANQKLKALPAQRIISSRDEQMLKNTTPVNQFSQETSAAASPLVPRSTSRSMMGAIPLNPFANREQTTWNDTADRKTRDRMEQEVLRLSAELERLRNVEEECTAWRHKHSQLQAEHDLLLQLYGQLEDEVGTSGSNPAAAAFLPAARS